MIRKAPPKVNEAKFQQLIRRGGTHSANGRQAKANAPRVAVLLRLEAGLVEGLDAILVKQRMNRNEALSELVYRVISGDITLTGEAL